MCLLTPGCDTAAFQVSPPQCYLGSPNMDIYGTRYGQRALTKKEIKHCEFLVQLIYVCGETAFFVSVTTFAFTTSSGNLGLFDLASQEKLSEPAIHLSMTGVRSSYTKLSFQELVGYLLFFFL